MNDEYTAVALCAIGAEKAAANELRKFSFKILDNGPGRLRFKSDIRGLYTALMSMRTADRILIEAARFNGTEFDGLFDGVYNTRWDEFIPPGMGLKVSKVRANKSRLSAVTSIQAVVHKAAAQKLCDRYKVSALPSQEPQAELRVYVEKDQVSVLLDLSGEPLFKRGYRIEGGIAPLRETTAAALLLLTNWKRKFPLYDPFSGSGTIAIEAALFAWNMAPGIGRSFALSRFLPGSHDLEREVREELLGRVDFSHKIEISGSDADPRAVSMASSNALRAYEIACGKTPSKRRKETAGHNDELPFLPIFKTAAMSEPKAQEREGYIITNPPYGKRLGDVADAEEAYREMAVLVRNFRGWKLGVITDHPGFESHFGYKASSVREITNGALGSYFYEFNSLI